jgi:tetratricopeptide (TPR) repeat protein
MNNLAATLQRAGRNEESLDLFRAVHETRRRILGDAHAATVTSLSNISVCLVALARLDEAEPLLRAALDGYTRVAGESHTKTLVTMANLAYLEEERGRDPEAEALYRRVIGLRTAAGNPGEPELLSVMNNLASLLQRRGDPAAAERVFADLCARCRGSLPAGHYLCAIFENNHGDCLIDLGRGTEAEPLLRSSLGALRATFGDHHPRAVKARARLDRLGVEDHPSAEPPVSPTPTRSANDSVSNPG